MAIAVEGAEHGPLMFMQSAGCCDGSLPMCFEESELETGERDVQIGRDHHFVTRAHVSNEEELQELNRAGAPKEGVSP